MYPQESPMYPQKSPMNLPKEPHNYTEEPYVSTKEPYVSTKEPYVSAKRAMWFHKRALCIRKRALSNRWRWRLEMFARRCWTPCCRTSKVKFLKSQLCDHFPQSKWVARWLLRILTMSQNKLGKYFSKVISPLIWTAGTDYRANFGDILPDASSEEEDSDACDEDGG